jgi:hypothetical protein
MPNTNVQSDGYSHFRINIASTGTKANIQCLSSPSVGIGRSPGY